MNTKYITRSYTHPPKSQMQPSATRMQRWRTAIDTQPGPAYLGRYKPFHLPKRAILVWASNTVENRCILVSAGLHLRYLIVRILLSAALLIYNYSDRENLQLAFHQLTGRYKFFCAKYVFLHSGRRSSSYRVNQLTNLILISHHIIHVCP
jgi:hypothetical protein